MCIHNYIIQLQLMTNCFVFGGKFILVGPSFESKANLITLWVKFDPTFSSTPNLDHFFVHPLQGLIHFFGPKFQIKTQI